MIIKDPETGRPVEVKEEDYPTIASRRGDPERNRHPGGGKMLTKQADKDSVDVNLIVKRHAQTGMWSHLGGREPSYGDFSAAHELQDALQRVQAAEDDFMSLPADVRALCNNNPVVLLEALADPELLPELVEAGLPMADGWEPEEVEPPATPVAPPPQEGGESPPQNS